MNRNWILLVVGGSLLVLLTSSVLIPAQPTPSKPGARVEVVNFPDLQAVQGQVNVANLSEVQAIAGQVSVSNLPVDEAGRLRVTHQDTRASEGTMIELKFPESQRQPTGLPGDPGGFLPLVPIPPRFAHLSVAVQSLDATKATNEIQEPPAAIAIVGATLIDGTGREPVEDAVVVIRDSRIDCVGSSLTCQAPTDARVVDARNRWLIPGLIDTHVHLAWYWRDTAHLECLEPVLGLLLAHGVTTIREASAAGRERELVELGLAIEGGLKTGPRIYVSGTLSRQNVRRYEAVDARALTHQLIALGVDGVKIRNLGSLDEVRAGIDEAHGARRPVYGHTIHGEGDSVVYLAREAAEGGLDGIMHIGQIAPVAEGEQENLPSEPSGEDTADLARDWSLYLAARWLHTTDRSVEALITAIVTHGTWLEPTLAGDETRINPSRYDDDATDRYLSKPCRVPRSRLELGGTDLERYRSAFRNMKRFVKRFHDAGGLVIAGTDGYPALLGLPDELQQLVEAGLSPMEALQAATRNAARALHWDDRIGTIEGGKLADLVLLEADPLRDVVNTRRVWMVFSAGRVVDRQTLLRPVR